MLPSSEYSATSIRMFLVDLETVIPICWTTCGIRGFAPSSLFWTFDHAMSGSVPGLKLSVMLALPAESL